MTARNDITGDALTTGSASDDYRANYDRIFRQQPHTAHPPCCFMTAADPIAHQCGTPACKYVETCKREQR